MTTKNLTYTANDASTLPVNGVQLTLQCLGSTGEASVFYGLVHLLAPFEGETGANGTATISNVPANADTDDPWSYYLFTARGETASGEGYFDEFFIVVPKTGGGTIDISTLKRDAPPVPGGAAPLHDQASHESDIWPDGTDQVGGASTLTFTGQAAAGVGSPSAGDNKLFVDSGSGHWTAKHSDGSTTDVESGGGSGGIIVQEADVTVAAAATTIDFGAGFDVTESPANEANIALDLSEATHNSLGGIGANDHHNQAHGNADHTTTGTPGNSAMGDAAAQGASASVARLDHTHGRESFATNALVLGAAAAAGAATTPMRSDDTIAAFDLTNPVTQAFNDIAATGSAAKAARRDHKHGMPATPKTVANDTLWDAAGDLAVGTGADAAAKLAITIPAANILNVLGVVNGETTWSVKPVHDGTSPAAVGTAAAGTALTASHRDHVHATGAGTPSTQAFGDAAATGTGPAASMTDHKHAMPNSTAGPDADITIDAAGAAGTASTAARAAHGHKLSTSATAALPTTTAAGTAGTSGHAPSRDDHTHQTGAHGAAEHTDITRSIWLTPAHQAGNAADGGTLNLVGTANPEKIPVWSLADAATQGFMDDFLMPADAKGSTAITVVVYWSPGSTDGTAHTVRWSMELRVVAAGDAVDVAGTTTAWTGDSATRTAKAMVIESGQQGLAATSANDLVRFNLRRVGADAADTYVGSVNVVGVRIDYTATQ